MSIERRIEALEGLIAPPEDEGAALRAAVRREVMEEFGRLKASRAVGYRGQGPGKPLRRIEPEDIPGRILGPGYTTGDMITLAIERVFERSGADEDLGDEALMAKWVRHFEGIFDRMGTDWNKQEDA